MATIKQTKRKNGATAYQIGFSLHGRRVWLSLGSAYTRQEAAEIARRVDQISAAITTGRGLDRRLESWLESTPDDLRRRFERAGLVETTSDPTLGELFDAYWDAEYYQLKPNTQSSKRQARRRFFEFVDPGTRVDAFGKRDAIAFVAWLDRRVREATRAGTIRDVRRVFNWAIKNDVVQANPFSAVQRGSFKNKSREYYVPLEDYQKLLDACPDQVWRAALALYRIGGLRLAEALSLTWADVDFPRGRLLVHSPKTERYRGRESRVVPLFPALRVELEKLWDATPEYSSPYVIATNRTTIRKHVEKIVFFAGLNRWERLIQNLRSSRAIEIEREFGALAEAEWIGHSPTTARDHYLHVLDEDFSRAVNGTAPATSARYDDARTVVADFRDHKNDHILERSSTQFDAIRRNSAHEEKNAPLVK